MFCDEYDYTHGSLGELLDLVIESGARLFVSAVGVPPTVRVVKTIRHTICI